MFEKYVSQNMQNASKKSKTKVSKVKGKAVCHHKLMHSVIVFEYFLKFLGFICSCETTVRKISR